MTSSPPVLTTDKNKIRLLIRFEDLNLPIWNKGDIFMSINKKYLELTKLKKIKKDNPLDTFLKIESFIDSQNLKFKKKLYRMYDLF